MMVERKRRNYLNDGVFYEVVVVERYVDVKSSFCLNELLHYLEHL